MVSRAWIGVVSREKGVVRNQAFNIKQILVLVNVVTRLESVNEIASERQQDLRCL